MTQPHEMTEDDKIEAALAALDQPQPEAQAEDSLALPKTIEADLPASPTLAELDATRRPKVKTVCETCPNSVWFTSTMEVKCYCRVMFLVTWSTKEPTQITGCDGKFLGQE